MKLRKLLSALLVLTMIFSSMSFAVMADEADASSQTNNSSVESLTGEGTKESPYLINNLDELIWFRDDINNGNTYKNKFVQLTSDINLNNDEWTPIGNSTYNFQGTFDGQNLTISNLLVSGYKSNAGFFGVTTNGEIKNLIINNASVSGRLNVGAVAGTPYTSKYTNIKVTGHVEINGMSYVGGVGGKNAYANWTDITVNADDTSYVKANSVENGTAYRTYVGGVIGFMGEGRHTFSNVTSNIDVFGSTCDVGGITGIAHYGNSFINCSSSGDVTLENATELSEATEIGGIAGVWHNGGANVTFDNLKYTGTLSSTYVDNNGNKVTLKKTDFANGGLIGAAYSSTGTGELVIPVAKIGNDTFNTFADAIEAANQADGAVTIELLCDVEWETGASHGSTPFINENSAATLTIEGNDFTIKATGSGVGPIRAANGTLLTFNNVNFVDNSVSYAESSWEFTYLEFDGKLKFTECDFADEIQIEGENASFTKCTFESNESSVYAVWICSGNNTFEECYFTGYRALKMHEDYGSEIDSVALNKCEFDSIDKKPGIVIGTLNAATNISVTNCTMKNVKEGDQGAYLYETDTDLTTFNFTTNNNKVFEGEEQVYPAVMIDETEYGTLTHAIAAAQNGDTIKLVFDAKAGKTFNINKDITIDLNGKTLTGNVIVEEGATVEIKNGTIICKNGTYDTINSFGNLTLTDVNADGERHIVRAKKGNVTINGGTYKYTGSATGTRHAVNIGDNDDPTNNIANATINGGTFIGPKGTSADSGSAVLVQSGSTVTINGGTFTKGKNNTLAAKSDATLIVKGGSFDQDPTAYVPEDLNVTYDGFKKLYNVSANWTVSATADKTEVYAGDKVQITIKASGENFTGADWNLTYDTSKFKLSEILTDASQDDKQGDGYIAGVELSGNSKDDFDSNTTLAVYEFEAIAQTEIVTGNFELTKASVGTVAMSPSTYPAASVSAAVSVKILLKDFDVTAKHKDTVITSDSIEIPLDNEAHKIIITNTTGAQVEYSTDGGNTWSTDVPEFKDYGEYTLTYRVEVPDGYVQNAKEPTTITVKIIEPEKVVEIADYVAGYKLVLVYTDVNNAYFTYGDRNVLMLDVTAAGYKYEDASYAHVYGYVVPAEMVDSETYADDAVYKNKVKFTNTSAKPEVVNLYDYDVNCSANTAQAVADLADVVYVTGVYNSIDSVMEEAYMKAILKADANREEGKEKIVDADDIANIKNDYMTNR